MTVRTIAEANAHAKSPRSVLTADGNVLGHAQALELVAQQNGARLEHLVRQPRQRCPSVPSAPKGAGAVSWAIPQGRNQRIIILGLALFRDCPFR
ncbi:hypothetical protein QE369_003547 [Agrobacterium larrymoorei]|uniref:Glyoxalase-related protein domain-containing protein n=1 Tax=Agrobacterium larrymoorei TaxID=160699 RepID=A0AAJ2BBG8_9HYPH|nr:hypothetical protein [Agrobacterium larrymoorei]MDR6103350.1 hypothetical protein [Agrobacterium larrymoorei]